MTINPITLLLTVLLFGAFTALVFLLARRIMPKTALQWTKLAARLGMIGATLWATLKVITSFIPGGVVRVQLGFPTFWPQFPKSVDYQAYGTGAIRVVGGGFNSATLDVTNANPGGRVAIAIGAVATALVVIVLCATADRIARDLESGLGFGGVTAKWLRRAGLITIIGGQVGRWATDIGQNLIAAQMQRGSFSFTEPAKIPNPWAGASDFSGIFGMAMPNSGIYINPELWAILTGIGLFVLARIVENGKRLEQETEGLV